MKLTKYDHACLLIENGQNKLMIDPGSYTKLPEDLTGIGTIVITHEHGDHLDVDNLREILRQSPEAEIFASSGAAAALSKEQIAHRKIASEDGVADLDEEECIVCHKIVSSSVVESGGFKLSFEEVDHAIIYSAPPCPNLSVGVDNFLYYPGDSFAYDGRSYDVLALPASGPWFNMAGAIDLAKNCKTRYIIGTHDIHASEKGQSSFYTWVGRHAGEDRELVHLRPGEAKEFR